MEVKPGYTQTEVGVIPEEWDVKHLGGLASVTAGGTPSRTNPEYWDGDIPWVTTTEVDFCTINRAEQFITKEGLKHSAAKLLPRGTLLMALYGQGKTRGKVGILGIDAATNQACAAISLNRSVSPEFVFHFLSSQYEVIRKLSNAGNQDNLNGSLVRSISILLPPEPEQRAIAEALSDVDGLLGGLDRLIAKKRDLKQAAMQQLLTGQTRLPGFHGEWEVKTLGNVFEITAGKSKSAYITDGGDFVICDMGSVSTDGILITSKRTNYRGDFLLKGDLVMPKDDIGGGKIIGRVGYVDCHDMYVLGDHVYRLRALGGDPLFLCYLINSHSINSALRKKVIGSAQLGLGRRSVEEQEIAFPNPDEQTAIAEVLTEMDADLAALEQRREKTRALKQAMMQELLTGRTRLIPLKEPDV